MTVCELDIRILAGLYEYRALTTEQIERMFGMSRWYTYRKLRILREGRLIMSEPVRGYAKKNQGKYHRISETGISCLKKQGMFVERQAHHLKVDDRMLPYLLTTNDLIVDLGKYGWGLTDSRDTKKRFSLNRSDNIQGLLEHGEENVEYGVYVFLRRTSEKNLQKTIRELRDYEDIGDYLLFTRGMESFLAIVEGLLSQEMVVAKRNSIKILPHSFGRLYLRHFWNEKQVFAYAEQKFGIRMIRRLEPDEAMWEGMNTIVLHEGEEKYFVNLMDTDLKKIFAIKQYRKEKYEQDGRKVLVLSQIEQHRDWLSDIHHIDYVDVIPTELSEYLEELG